MAFQATLGSASVDLLVEVLPSVTKRFIQKVVADPVSQHTPTYVVFSTVENSFGHRGLGNIYIPVTPVAPPRSKCHTELGK